VFPGEVPQVAAVEPALELEPPSEEEKPEGLSCSACGPRRTGALQWSSAAAWCRRPSRCGWVGGRSRCCRRSRSFPLACSPSWEGGGVLRGARAPGAAVEPALELELPSEEENKRAELFVTVPEGPRLWSSAAWCPAARSRWYRSARLPVGGQRVARLGPDPAPSFTLTWYVLPPGSPTV